METRPIIAIPFVLLLVMFVVVTTTAAIRFRSEKRSLIALFIAALPGLLMLGLFYSLAIHMRHSMGIWPAAIGEKGFPPSLVTHADIAASYFTMLFLITLFIWPIVSTICLLVQQWRSFTKYLAVYAFSFLASFGLMMLAPTPFLNWWWD